MSFFTPSDFGPPYGANFIPNLQYVISITQAQQAIVTFASKHNFTLWEWISFRIPPSNGMTQLNNEKGQIIALTPMTVTIDMNTLGFFPFIAYSDPQIPCIAVPAGSGVEPYFAATTLEDSFDNEPTL